MSSWYDYILENPDKDWDYNYLSENPNITWDIVESVQNKPWCYLELSRNKMSKHPHFTQLTYLLK